MKVKKIVLATLLGCLVMFAWGGLSHLVLFVGTGFKQLPNEDKVLEVLNSNIPEQGLYFFPGKDFRNSTEEEEMEWASKFTKGPVGMLIYKPVGGAPFSINSLLIQLSSSLLSVFIAVVIASLIYGGYWKRVAVIALLGILVCSAVSTIYWNWYNFPTSFFIAQILDMTIGFLIVGLLICKIIPQYSIAEKH